MRPPHPNDLANQAALMKRTRDTVANSIPVAGSVVQRTSNTESNLSVTNASVRQPWQNEGDFSFAR